MSAPELTTIALSDTTSPGRFLATLDMQLADMATNAHRLPTQLRPYATTAVEAVRADVLEVTSHSDLRALAARYARPDTALDPVTTALRAKVADQVTTYLHAAPPVIEARPKEPTPIDTPRGATTPQPSTQPTLQPSPKPDGLAQEPAKQDAPRLPQQGIQPRDVVLFRNGPDQTRWGIVDRPHTNGAYVVRVGGQPFVVPAISITHTVDPRKQPDLPIDSIIEKGTMLPVRRVSWGQDAQRLEQVAKGQPGMRRLASVTDNFDLRDGIGTSNERVTPEHHRLIESDQRRDQQPDNTYHRNSTVPATDHIKFKDRDDQPHRLPTAGPRAMQRAAALDDQPHGQTRILVTGSRELNAESAPTIKAALVREIGTSDPATFTIVHGASKGADELAHKAARELGMRVQPFRADWQTHGNAAGPIRNQEMLDSGVHKVIAFTNKPLEQSRDTQALVGRARNAGIPTAVVDTATPTITATVTARPSIVAPQPTAPKLTR